MKLAQVKIAFLMMALASVLAVSLACSSAEPTATPAAAPTPTQKAAPTTAPAAVPTATPTRIVQTAAPAVIQARHGPVDGAQRGGNVRYGGLTDVKSMDPIFIGNNPERPIHHVLYNQIVKFEPDFSLSPELAKSWDISADGKSVTFKLQEGVKFQDGTDFNADAVKWNFDRLLNPDYESVRRAVWAPLIDSISVVDKNTVTFKLKAPSRPFISFFGDALNGAGIVSPTAVQKYGGKRGGDYGRNPVGTGAFKLKEWSLDDKLIMVPFENYWEKGLPYLDQLTILFVPDRTVQVAMLRTGELDIQDALTANEVTILQRNPNLKIADYASCRIVGLRFSTDRPPWDNKALRQALAYDMDQKALIDTLAGGKGRQGHAPEGDCFWWSNATLSVYDYDLTKAKAKMAEAGYPNGIEVDFWASATTDDMQASETYQAMFARVGIRTKITTVPPQDFFPNVRARKIHMGTMNYVPRPDPDGRLTTLFHSQGQSQLTGYKNADLDKLLEKAAATYDRSESKKLYDQIQQILVAEVPGIIVSYFPTEFTAMSLKVQNYVDIPDRMLRLRYLWMKQ